MEFSDRLSHLIEGSNLNNLRLSKEIGVADRLIGAWRKGEKRPTLDNLVLLADYFRISVDYLVGRSEVREMAAKKEPLPCSTEAVALGARYDALDDDGKAMVRSALIGEERRIEERKKANPGSSETKAV